MTEQEAKTILIEPHRKYDVSAITDQPVIYFLYHNGVIVYVGKSDGSLFGRVNSHLKDKVFDSISFINCDLDYLDETEVDYIVEHTPKYNYTVGCQGVKWWSLECIKEESARTRKPKSKFPMGRFMDEVAPHGVRIWGDRVYYSGHHAHNFNINVWLDENYKTEQEELLSNK